MSKLLRPLRGYVLNKYNDFKQGFIVNSTLGRKLNLTWKTNHRILDLITTSGCNSMCYDCSQMCRQAPAKKRISEKHVKEVIRDSIKRGHKWKRIVVSGGESILEDNFFKILELVRKYRAEYSPKTKLVVLTNGRGDRVKELLKKVPKDVTIINSNKTSSYSPHFISINAAPIDNPKFKSANFKAGCRITSKFGITRNWNGYYCCATGSAIDRVMKFNLGRKNFPEDNDNFEDQKDMLCRYCGSFLSCDYRNEKGYQSKSWKKAFAKYNQKNKLYKKNAVTPTLE